MEKEMTIGWARAVGAVLALVLAACSPGDRAADEPTPDVAPAVVVDSVMPMDVALARFREGLIEPSALQGGAASRDELVEGIVRALEASDTAAFESLAVDRAEFAWLYFPDAPIARSPYELSPSLAWFRLQEGNRQGVFRALRDFGGRDLGYQGYRCAVTPVQEGENRLWTGCLVALTNGPAGAASVPLFASILERGGRFAVLSYGNDF